MAVIALFCTLVGWAIVALIAYLTCARVGRGVAIIVFLIFPLCFLATVFALGGVVAGTVAWRRTPARSATGKARLAVILGYVLLAMMLAAAVFGDAVSKWLDK